MVRGWLAYRSQRYRLAFSRHVFDNDINFSGDFYWLFKDDIVIQVDCFIISNITAVYVVLFNAVRDSINHCDCFFYKSRINYWNWCKEHSNIHTSILRCLHPCILLTMWAGVCLSTYMFVKKLNKCSLIFHEVSTIPKQNYMSMDSL